MEKHSVSKLIGSPPGYVGHEEGGQLTERVKRSPYSVLLFDEIEKAHPDIFNVLLQVFEDGILTDALGNTIDFKHAIIIMTSNIGARFIQKRGTLGFQGSTDISRGKLEEMVMTAVRQTFNPEFINRLDEIIVFDELGDEELLDVLQLQIDQINATMTNHGFIVRLTDDAPIAPMECVLCAARCKRMSKIRFRRRSSRVNLAKPRWSRCSWTVNNSASAHSWLMKPASNSRSTFF